MMVASSRLLQTILPNVLATRVEHPFGGTLTKTRAFLIQRSGGGKNVWVYSSSHVEEYLDHIAELGGVSHQLLNHRDEASRFCNVLDAPVFCHELEKQAVEEKGCVVDQTYDGQEHKFGDDLTALYTPGHSRGVTSYLWRCGEDDVTVLFPGDTLYIDDQGRLNHGPLQFHAYRGNREDMIRTLSFFIELNPTYLIPGLIQSDDFVSEFKADEVRALVDKLKSGK